MAYVTGSNGQDVDLQLLGSRYAVVAGPLLRRSKWRGGIWVYYVDSPEGDAVVEQSDGTLVAGFLLFPSERYLPGAYGPDYGSTDNYTGIQPASGVGGQNVVTMITGGGRAFFRLFETVSLVGGVRNGPPIVYSANQTLYVSENGILCNDSVAELILAGIPAPIPVGIVCGVPAARNGMRLGMDIHF
jgi:hypothetical protein